MRQMTEVPPLPAVSSADVLQCLYSRALLDLQRRLAAIGYPNINPAHGNVVLRQIATDGSLTPEIARRCCLALPVVDYLVDQLARAGFVECRPDPARPSVRVVRLTGHGRTMMQASEWIIDRFEATWVERLGAGLWRDLPAILDDLPAHRREHEPVHLPGVLA